MALKENLLKKIRIDGMARRVIASLAPREGLVNLDKEAMRRLLEDSGARFVRIRDLDLYVLESSDHEDTILVLDNDLPVYRSTPEDVALRKSPLLKEMLSIRNIRKILNDADVIVCKRGESVEVVRGKCLGRLDLSVSGAELEIIENEGIGSLESGDADGVLESLSLFAELLHYRRAPDPLYTGNDHLLGAWSETGKRENGQAWFGPMIVYDPRRNVLRFFEERIGSRDREKLKQILQRADAKESKKDGFTEGFAVFTLLREMVLQTPYVPGLAPSAGEAGR